MWVKNEHFWISSLLMLRTHHWLNSLLTVPGGWTLLLTVETSEYQLRKAVSRNVLEQGALAWLWRCLSHMFVYATGLLYVSLKYLSYGGNKYRVIFLLAMNDVSCTYWDIPGSAFSGADVSATPPHKTSQPQKVCCSDMVYCSCETNTAWIETIPYPRVSLVLPAVLKAPVLTLSSISMPFHNRAYVCQISYSAINVDTTCSENPLPPEHWLMSKVKYLQCLNASRGWRSH